MDKEKTMWHVVRNANGCYTEENMSTEKLISILSNKAQHDDPYLIEFIITPIN